MKTSKNILKYFIEEQVDFLRKEVYITDKDFNHVRGIIVSLRTHIYYYWVLLDRPYKTKYGKYTRIKLCHGNIIEIQ